MATVEDALKLVTEAAVTLTNLAEGIRSGNDPEIVAAQADTNSATLNLAVANMRAEAGTTTPTA